MINTSKYIDVPCVKSINTYSFGYIYILAILYVGLLHIAYILFPHVQIYIPYPPCALGRFGALRAAAAISYLDLLFFSIYIYSYYFNILIIIDYLP